MYLKIVIYFKRIKDPAYPEANNLMQPKFEFVQNYAKIRMEIFSIGVKIYKLTNIK